MEPRTLLPNIEGLHLDYLNATGDTVVVHMSALAPSAQCPSCMNHSARIHSHYQRTLADLPWAHCAVRIQIAMRKFFCDNPQCQRRIFTEPIPDLAARYARKTRRLQKELYLIGYSLGGRAGTKEAEGLGRDVSADTLLRQVRKATVEQDTVSMTIRVLGVDDFAFRKGHHYGTILIDQERHCPIDVLPDRESNTLSEWLQAHPGVEVISRDRACAYSEGASAGAPDAMQVADRFHLVHNLVEALQNLLGRNHAALRQAAEQVNTPTPSNSQEPQSPQSSASMPTTQTTPVDCVDAATCAHPLTREEKESTWRRDRRFARYTEVIARHDRGESLRSIAHVMGLSRTTVSQYVHAGGFAERAKRPVDERKIAPFIAYVKQRWDQGCHKITQLYREIQEQGFGGTYQQLYRYLARAQLVVPGLPRSPMLSTFPLPSARSTAWWLVLKEKPRDAQEQAFLDALCAICPEIACAQELVLEFFGIVHDRRGQDLEAWQARVTQSQSPELKSFAGGLARDEQAVLTGLTQPYSNGQTEGQVNRLKLIKRSMYGRANFDLLRARVLPMAQVA